ncbi:hypothetical protein [Deinococcus ruber]|nr:hypothetical protein [Deinococcus ruber]
MSEPSAASTLGSPLQQHNCRACSARDLGSGSHTPGQRAVCQYRSAGRG